MATGTCSLCSQVKSLRNSASCGCQYCTMQCGLDYMLRTVANGQVICQTCSRPFTDAFISSYFGSVGNLIAQARARNQPVQRSAPQAPIPPRMLHCDICKQQYPETQQWTLSCQHTYCKPCLVARIQSGVDHNDPVSINCPGCSVRMKVEDVEALTIGNKSLWMAYQNLVGLTNIFIPGELVYQCPTHHFFRAVYEAGLASIKCPQCPTDICLACKKPYAAGHKC